MPKKREVLIESRKIKKFFPLKRKSIFQLRRFFIRALEDVSIQIYRGETFGLVGESGCGKSTLGRVMLQLYPPTSGSALYYGIPLREINPKYVLKEIKKLPRYQAAASRAYKLSLLYDRFAEKVNQKIKSIDPALKKDIIVTRHKLIDEKIVELKKLEVEQIAATIQALKDIIPTYKEKIAAKPNMYVNPKWESDIHNVLNLMEKNSNNTTIPDLIDLLNAPHKEANKAMKALVKTRQNIKKANIEKSNIGVGKNWQKLLKHLQNRALGLRKIASRNLREGSKTGGEFILEADIKEISHKMYEYEVFAREVHQARKRIKRGADNIIRLEKRLADLNNKIEKYDEDKPQGENLKTLTNKAKLTEQSIIRNKEEDRLANEKIKVGEAKMAKLEANLKTYHKKNVLPITERTLDPAYQDKMERNREYAVNLERLSREEMRVLRQKMQFIFQDPYSSLNPRMTVGQAISEAVVEHGLYKKRSPELEEYVVDVMAKCGLDHYMIHRYPHQFSGGQRQRIVIARALALQPEFIICDESVSALDVSIQSQILNLLQDLKDDSNLTYLFISHDLSVIKHISDRIGVMYLGNLVELCDSEKLYEKPLHPYSKALISAIPTTSQEEKKRIILKGDIPSNIFPPSGCKFRTRCPLAREKCALEVPEFKEIEPGHFVACHFYEETKTII